jgi:hypothetical protein
VGCRERVEGFRDRVSAWARRSGVAAGPLLLASIKGLAEQPAWTFWDEPARPRSSLPVRGRRRPGRYLAHKALVIVAPGARVMISGPADAVAFAYDRDTTRDGSAMRIPGDPAAVTFQACPPGQRAFSASGRLRFTEFAGGIAVAGPRCVPLDIRDERSGRTWRRWVSFGTRGAGCHDP